MSSVTIKEIVKKTVSKTILIPEHSLTDLECLVDGRSSMYCTSIHCHECIFQVYNFNEVIKKVQD